MLIGSHHAHPKNRRGRNINNSFLDLRFSFLFLNTRTLSSKGSTPGGEKCKTNNVTKVKVVFTSNGGGEKEGIGADLILDHKLFLKNNHHPHYYFNLDNTNKQATDDSDSDYIT